MDFYICACDNCPAFCDEVLNYLCEDCDPDFLFEDEDLEDVQEYLEEKYD